MTAKALLYGPDLQSFRGAGKGRRRRPAIRRPSESRQQLVRSAGLLRCHARRQENPSRPGFATGQPIRHCSYKLYGGVEEVSEPGAGSMERRASSPVPSALALGCSRPARDGRGRIVAYRALRSAAARRLAKRASTFLCGMPGRGSLSASCTLARNHAS